MVWFLNAAWKVEVAQHSIGKRRHIAVSILPPTYNYS